MEFDRVRICWRYGDAGISCRMGADTDGGGTICRKLRRANQKIVPGTDGAACAIASEIDNSVDPRTCAATIFAEGFAARNSVTCYVSCNLEAESYWGNWLIREEQVHRFRGARLGKRRADSLQQTADSERKARREKRRGIFPLTSDPLPRWGEEDQGKVFTGCKARLPRTLRVLLRNRSLVSPPSTGGFPISSPPLTGGDKGEGE